MNKAKISITLSNEFMHFIGQYQAAHSHLNRSDIIQEALECLRERELGKDYLEANKEINHDFDNCTQDGIDAPW